MTMVTIQWLHLEEYFAIYILLGNGAYCVAMLIYSGHGHITFAKNASPSGILSNGQPCNLKRIEGRNTNYPHVSVIISLPFQRIRSQVTVC